MTTTSLPALVSSEMVEAGYRVLDESGFLWMRSPALRLLVRQILEAALARQAEVDEREQA